MRRVLLLFACVACGRVGYDARRLDGDAAIDAPIQAPACPAGTTSIGSDTNVCIEKLQRGSVTWTAANSSCQALDRRLCLDLEWFAGCTNGAGVTQTTDDWEWVAENDGAVAQKRGGDGTCAGMSSHEIFIDSYGYRCCTTKQ